MLPVWEQKLHDIVPYLKPFPPADSLIYCLPWRIRGREKGHFGLRKGQTQSRNPVMPDDKCQNSHSREC